MSPNNSVSVNLYGPDGLMRTIYPDPEFTPQEIINRILCEGDPMDLVKNSLDGDEVWFRYNLK